MRSKWGVTLEGIYMLNNEFFSEIFKKSIGCGSPKIFMPPEYIILF
jgi:hypothetical protein